MIRTMLVDDARPVRRSIRLLLDATADIEVVGEAENGVDAVRLAREIRPDVILMDIRMPGGGGLDAIETLSGIGVKDPIPIIALTSFNLDEYVYGAMERGAVGFLLKKNPGDIPAAIRASVNATALQSPLIRQRFLADYALGGARRSRAATEPRLADADLHELLGDRELEVLNLIVAGLPNPQIAEQLSMTVSNVKRHIGNLLEKTGTDNRTQLAIWGATRGLNPSV